MKQTLRFILGSMAFTLLFLSINSGGPGSWLEKPAYGGVTPPQPLKLLVLQKALTYQKLHLIESGFEYELLQQFAADSGFDLQIKLVSNEKELLRRLSQGKGDMAAARFSDSSPNLDSESVLKSQAYDEGRISLVCRHGVFVQWSGSGNLDPETNKWKLLINPTSMEARWATDLKKQAPDVKVSTRLNASNQQLLKSLKDEKADCTVMDHLEAQYHLRVFQNLEIIKDISPTQNFFFLISSSRPELQSQFHKWMTRTAHKYLVSQAKARVKGKASELSPREEQRFALDREQILPKYSLLLQKHAAEFGLPWQLMAAISYQESRWNPEAQSMTGVKGFMQLTNETAEHLGVEDREDPGQSIWGGVKYIKMLINRQPKSLSFKDRLALALATYNVGPAHMQDAQKLALKLGKNPYSWKDLQTVLPLLAEDDYLPELKYGPARGLEPVIYVKRVFSYLELMSVQI
jgi:membrane-bound lytic murein transglycosylase F